ncbi:MAG: ketosteroid isomerase-like protein [Halioglobus sp.]|jgi:ketosteroid isomerase-like protein
MSISVEDYIAIQRLMYAYAHCADHKDYAGFADVFCEDAVFGYRGEPVTPLAAIQDMMLALEKYSRTLHQVTNVFYEVEGDSAQGETYCLASHIFEDAGLEMKIDMGIVYNDALRRLPQGWRILNRQFTLLWSQTTQVD